MAEDGSASSDWDHGPPDGGEPGPRGIRGDRLEPHARARRGAGGEFDNVTWPPAPPRPRAAGIAISMVPDVPEVEAVLLGADGAADGPARRRPGHRHVHDRAHRQPLDRQAARRARLRVPRRARHRLTAQGRGRHAHDHGRRAQGGVRPGAARVRGDGPAGAARRPAGPRVDDQADQQHARGGERGRARRGDRDRAGRRSWTWTRCSRWWPPAPASPRCAR